MSLHISKQKNAKLKRVNSAQITFWKAVIDPQEVLGQESEEKKQV